MGGVGDSPLRKPGVSGASPDATTTPDLHPNHALSKHHQAPTPTPRSQAPTQATTNQPHRTTKPMQSNGRTPNDNRLCVWVGCGALPGMCQQGVLSILCQAGFLWVVQWGGLCVPRPVAICWTPSALFCDAGIRLCVCRPCGFVRPSSSCPARVRDGIVAGA